MREQVLSCILRNHYGELLGEAVAVIRSRGLFFANHKEEAIALLDTWRRREEISDLALGAPRIDKPSDMGEILALLQFEKVMQFFLNDYTMNPPRPEWIEPGQWEEMLPLKLSGDERHRFLRALCRLQTHSNIFADPEHGPENDAPWLDNNWFQMGSGSGSEEEEAYRVFYGTLPPWEYDEMGCVWAYLKTKFDPMYKVVSDSVHDLIEKHGNADPRFHDYLEDLELPHDQKPPCYRINSLRDLEDLPNRTDALAALGPSFLYRLLHANPLLQRDMVLANASSYGETFIGRTGLPVSEHEMLPLIYPADRHAVKDFDHFWSTLAPLERPNRAWKNVSLMAHTPEENFEDVVDLVGEQETGWNWGIAIWDDQRLMEWEAPDLQRPQRIKPPIANPYG